MTTVPSTRKQKSGGRARIISNRGHLTSNFCECLRVKYGRIFSNIAIISRKVQKLRSPLELSRAHAQNELYNFIVMLLFAISFFSFAPIFFLLHHNFVHLQFAFLGLISCDLGVVAAMVASFHLHVYASWLFTFATICSTR